MRRRYTLPGVVNRRSLTYENHAIHARAADSLVIVPSTNQVETEKIFKEDKGYLNVILLVWKIFWWEDSSFREYSFKAGN